MILNSVYRFSWVAVLVPLLVFGCAQQRTPQEIQPEPFKLRDVAKSDVDTVVEVHQKEIFRHLRALMKKLYRRNPREWKKTGKPSMEGIVDRVFNGKNNWRFEELEGKTGTDCISLAFDNDYRGDRVLAFTVGIASMLYATYDNKSEFFVIDDVNPQKLYNGARNVEVAVWKLSNDSTPSGEPYLLSNSTVGEPRNLSFERLFGKIIGAQDILARIVADKTNRRIKFVIQTVIPKVFLPI